MYDKREVYDSNNIRIEYVLDPNINFFKYKDFFLIKTNYYKKSQLIYVDTTTSNHQSIENTYLFDNYYFLNGLLFRIDNEKSSIIDVENILFLKNIKSNALYYFVNKLSDNVLTFICDYLKSNNYINKSIVVFDYACIFLNL